MSLEDFGGIWRSLDEFGGFGGVRRTLEELGGVWRSLNEIGGGLQEFGGV